MEDCRPNFSRLGRHVDFDRRQLAVLLARGRVIIGLGALVAPGLVIRVFMGESTTTARALTRMLGARDVALGVGAITTLKERTQDAEWVSMGAVADGVDALVGLFTPGLTVRARLMGVVAAGSAALGLEAARRLADERAGATPDAAR
jgi:hypothetical protein